jgi:drug/metabolite transporter (DMT)-like permease
MEPVWAAFFAVLLGGENLTVRMLVGGALVLGAMYLAELAPRGRLPDETPHLPL